MEIGDNQGGEDPQDTEGKPKQKVPIAEDYESTTFFVPEEMSSVEEEEESENRKVRSTEEIGKRDSDSSLPSSDAREENEER